MMHSGAKRLIMPQGFGKEFVTPEFAIPDRNALQFQSSSISLSLCQSNQHSVISGLFRMPIQPKQGKTSTSWYLDIAFFALDCCQLLPPHHLVPSSCEAQRPRLEPRQNHRFHRLRCTNLDSNGGLSAHTMELRAQPIGSLLVWGVDGWLLVCVQRSLH